ncbi:MAG: AAA family ATPase [Deltaproteobacteria bacterium]|nr:AAA family ATPase [Deltaproteobacteria bacterium]
MSISYIARHGESELARHIADATPFKPVLLLEGARQVGKTTLAERVLRQSPKRAVHVNLERDSLIRSALDACRDFAEYEDVLRDRFDFRGDADRVLFIDEAQESRKLGEFVRFMKEEWSKATVILSGSTLTRLFRPTTRYPVGRVRRFVLGPFSFSEFLVALGRRHLADLVVSTQTRISDQRHAQLLTLFDAFLAVGGLPAVVQAHASGDDHGLVLRQIIADYEQDFIRIFGEDSIDIAMACLRSVANFAGGASKNTAVVPAPSTRVNERINHVFARFEGWHLVLRSDQMGMNPQASHGYLPKRYLFDTGVLRELRESAVPSISAVRTLSAAARTPLGAVIENQTAIELMRSRADLSGWKRTPSGAEIDFVVKRGGTVFPVECKAALTVNRKHMRGVTGYLRQHGLRTGYLVSLAPYSTTTLDDVRIVNLPGYLLERVGCTSDSP